MLHDFEKSNKINFTTLSNVHIQEYLETLLSDSKSKQNNKNAGETTTIQTTKNKNGDVVNRHIDDTEDLPSLLPLQSIAHEERVECNLSPTQILFIAIALVCVAALRLFMLCPDVVWCDVTSHSNNKGFCLLTFSCWTSVGKQVIFLWIWIPNEKRFSFCWVFQHAIPILIPISIRKRVSFIMKDGDLKQRNVFPNAIEGSCGWHIGKNLH